MINAYLIAFGSFLLLAGRLGDLIGRKRMFLAGIAIFTGASVLCGLAEQRGDADRGALRAGLRRRGALVRRSSR